MSNGARTAIRGRPPRERRRPRRSRAAPLGEGRGLDLLLAKRAGLEAADKARAEVPVTTRALAATLDLAVDAVGEPHLALDLPAELPLPRWDAGALAARVAASPREALRAFARFALLVFPRLEVTLVSSPVATDLGPLARHIGTADIHFGRDSTGSRSTPGCLASFGRAFKRWTGTPRGTYRRRTPAGRAAS